MLRKTRLPRQNRVISLLLFAGAAVAVSAQPAHDKDHPPKVSGAGALTPAMVKTGLYVISGGGCNSLLRLSADGFIFVDGKFPANYPAILALTKKLSYSDQPIRILINTDYHQNHTANNGNFREDGAAILAHENVKRYLTEHPPNGEVTLPTKTYDREFNIKLGGIEARLLHFGNARTNGDTVVYFPDLKVVAVGDLFSTSPDADFAAGGSMVGWAPVIAEILKLDFDVVVPGQGLPISRADLEAYKTKLDTLVARAAGLAKQGVAKNRLAATLKTDDLGWQLSFTGDRLDRFYNELTLTK